VVLTTIFVVLHLIVCVVLMGLILMHSGKDSGMASVTGFSFASSASVMERNLTRYTIVAGVAFFVTTMLLVWRLS
jgi:protein translocase SecG subunit